MKMPRILNDLLIGLPPPGRLGRLVRARSALLILLVFGLFLVACAGAAATDQTNADPANTDQANGPVSEELPAAFIDADAAAIVAAQERVLIGIYDRLLPSVVEIRASR